MKHIAWLIGGMALMAAPAWVAGVASSTRVNTAAAEAYAESLDLQAQSQHERAIAAKLLACEQEGIDLRAAIAVKDQKFAQAATQAADELKASQEQYTEMVIGLREQLQQAHVPERIVRATR